MYEVGFPLELSEKVTVAARSPAVAVGVPGTLGAAARTRGNGSCPHGTDQRDTVQKRAGATRTGRRAQRGAYLLLVCSSAASPSKRAGRKPAAQAGQQNSR